MARDVDRDAVVVTGTGLCTALGNGVDRNWQQMLAGARGFRPIESFPIDGATVTDGGLAPALDDDPRSRAYAEGRERQTAYLEAAVREALRSAGCTDARVPDRDGACLMVGSSLAASASSSGFWERYIADDGGPPPPDFALLDSYDIEPMLAQVCERFGIGGQALLVANACAAGGSSIALAWESLVSGESDFAIACGIDTLELHTFAGFHSLSLLTPEPDLAPFSRERRGMKLGDGFAALVLEREADARAAGRTPLARLVGCGESADAHSMTQPHPEGLGAALAIRRALASAGRSADEVDYVNLHATSTPSNDVSEVAALRDVFGERLPEITLHAVKPSVGHTLGAAGTIDAVVTIEVLRHGTVPATRGVADELEFGDAHFARAPERRPIRLALSNAFGFGGANSALLFEGCAREAAS